MSYYCFKFVITSSFDKCYLSYTVNIWLEWYEGLTGACGGPDRGICTRLEDLHEYFSPPVEGVLLDDRTNWPTRFFRFACECFGNYAGYMCHQCQFGYYGKFCQKKRILERRDILDLNKSERKRFVDVVLKSKSALSDYVIMKDQIMAPKL